MTSWDRLRSIGNLLNLSTPLGLGLALLGGARLRQGPGRLLLAEGYRYRFPTGAAFTVGDVVLSRYAFRHEPSPGDGARGRPASEPLRVLPDRLLAHEGRHAWQWLVCGAAFLPLYGAATAWSWLRTGDRAQANVFERWADLADGGYLPPIGNHPRR